MKLFKIAVKEIESLYTEYWYVNAVNLVRAVEAAQGELSGDYEIVSATLTDCALLLDPQLPAERTPATKRKRSPKRKVVRRDVA